MTLSMTEQRVDVAQTVPASECQAMITPPTTPLKSRVARLSPASFTSSTFSLTGSSRQIPSASSSESPSLQASPSPSSSSESSVSSFSSESESESDSSDAKEALQLPILEDGALVEDLMHLMIESDVVDDKLAAEASTAAEKKMVDFAATSKLLRRQRQPIPLTWEDVKIEKLLGVGGFCCATLASIPKLEERMQEKNLESSEEGESDDDENDSDTGSEQPRLPYRRSSSAILDDTECPRGKYALKCLNKASVSTSKKFVRAAEGLAYEASILSCLDHENIIQIHGVCSTTDASTFRRPGGYFVVLQCMKRTLDDVLRAWRKADEPVPVVNERLRTVALGVAKGMAYLHSNNIVFRDIKPHNIGIDYDGNPRIFDFGIAKELEEINPWHYNENEPKRLPVIKGCVGSLRYMAPEVLIQHRASYPSDVYSYAILLWQICTLKKPFGSKMHSANHFRQYVGQMNVRPPIPPALDGDVKRILKAGWHEDSFRRPTFPEIIEQLQQILDGSSASESTRSLSSASNQLDCTSSDLSSQSSPKSHRMRLSKLIPSFLKPKKRTVPVSS